MLNKQEETLLKELLNKYKQGYISGLIPGSNITFSPSGCRNKIVSSTGSGGGGGAYIPLSGTEVGSPVTGSISLYSAANEYNYNVSAGDDFSVYTDDDYNGFGMNKQGIVFNFTGLNSHGLDGAAYYGENYNDNTYVQKKYVDSGIVDVDFTLINTFRSLYNY